MTAEELVAAIERHTKRPGRRNGRNVRLLCPAHDDHHPSLDVAEGADGQAILVCRSHGCTYQQILGALGLEDTASGDDPDWTPNGPALAYYSYIDEERRLLFQVCRTADKNFPLRRPDPTSRTGWRWKLGTTRKVLYRLPRVLEAVAAGETIYIPEGEKDVGALERLGVTATCNPGGAGNWTDEYATPLAGADVVVIADRDLPGYAHARRVARSLTAVGARVALRQPLPDHLGADVSDHLAAGHGLDELVPLTRAEGEFQLVVRTAVEIIAIPDPPDDYQLLGPYIYRGARTIIVGDTGHGKTSLALRMVGAVLKGEAMLGQTGAGVGPALVVDLEQGIRSIKRGLREAELADRDDVLYVTVPDGLALDRDEAHYAALDAALADYRPAMLLLDPFYKAHRADDPNAERPIIDLMRQLDALRAAYEFALIMPAHPRKDVAGREGARKLTVHDVAGSGAVTRGAEIVLGLERLGHGYARLRYLKDRDGDLPVGDAINLVYSKEEGFRIDPRDDASDEALEARALAEPQPWMTVGEWAKLLKVRQGRAREILAGLAEAGRAAFMIGPPGRDPRARCYATVPEAWEHMGIAEQLPLESECVPGPPLSLKRERTSGTPDEPAGTGNSDVTSGAADEDGWTS